jgi:asparagine synthase (glutamine-hydrolysing)
MCGIAGFIDGSGMGTASVLKKITDSIAHRGPDAAGYLLFEQNGMNIGFGHRRLSIIDLSQLANQPMEYDNLVMIYNGEVYNYKSIRNELENEGYSFSSESDTEVIIKAIHKWGIEKTLSKLNGMFAIALYDKKKSTLSLIRDRVGVKPLYYYFQNGTLVFSSELKPIMLFPNFYPEINKNALFDFLCYGYIAAPQSIFKHVKKIKPGTILSFKDDVFTESTYWSIEDKFQNRKINFNITENEAVDQLDNILTDSVSLRMIADVPIGCFLSGGYDSSLVTAVMQKISPKPINTFTIGFDEKKYDEAPHAKKISNILGTNHYELYCSLKEAEMLIPSIVEFSDEPFGDTSQLPTMLVSKLAKKHVTVALSGDGGDELFCGYSRYEEILHLKKISMISKILISTNKVFDIKSVFNQINRKSTKLFYLDSNPNIINSTFLNSGYYLKNLIKDHQFTTSNDDLSDLLNLSDNIQEQHMLLDLKTYLPDDVLTKVDRATMSVSLEGREPLLDYRLIEYSFNLPHNLKYNSGEKKYLLKKLTHKYLPEKLMKRPKMGFGIPIYKWLRNEFKYLLDEYLSEKFIKDQNIFNYSEVSLLQKQFQQETSSEFFPRMIWHLLVFQIWYTKYYKNSIKPKI